jgi:DNA repair exonuclease SbcCD nuclease subunit
MFKFIHTADIHLDSPLHRLEVYEGAPVAAIRHASRRALENLVDLALGEAVDFILIAGDLFDGDWQDYHTGLFFTAQMARLKAAGIAVFMVAGNHDAAGRMTRRLPYPDNVHLFSHRAPETRRLESLRVAIHGQSFAKTAEMANLAQGYPEPLPGDFNIGLLHTSLTGRTGHESYAPCRVADLTSRGYDYWALGHVHQFEIVTDDPPVVFPGCLQGRHVRETGAKGAVAVNVVAGSAPEIVHHPLDVIRWSQVTVDLESSGSETAVLDRMIAAVADAMQTNDPLPLIVRLRLTGSTAMHDALTGNLDYWKQALRAAALANRGERVWIEGLIVATRRPAKSIPPALEPGPLQELDLLTAAIVADNDLLLDLGYELSALFRKLPAEYRRGEQAIDPANPDHLRQLVHEAHALLRREFRKAGPGA